ncbi:hypothetical protein [Oceaniferula spumae]
MISPRFLLASALAIFGIAPVSAAPDASSIQIKIRVVCAAYHPTVRKLEVGMGESEERLNFPVFDDAFSDPQKYKGSSAVPVYVPGQQEPFARVKVPAGSKNVIFLCVPTSAQSAGGPYRILPVPSDDSSFAFGTRRIFNLTRGPIGVRYGKAERRVMVAPGIKPTDLVITESSAGERRFAVEFFTQKDKEWIRFSATRWSVDDSKRSFLFIFNDPQSGRVRYRAVSEYYVAPELLRRREEEIAKSLEENAEKDAEANRKGAEQDAKIQAEIERRKKAQKVREMSRI